MVSLVGILAIAAQWVPELIKSTAGGGSLEQRATKHFQQSLHRAMAADSLLETFVLRPNQYKIHPRKSAVAHVGTEPMTEDLRFGRDLVEKGNAAKARAYYERYLKDFPDSIQPRLELAKVYLAVGETHAARLLCLRTLKRQLSPSEIGSVWKLLGQCQTK
jgi:hypothetical protein